MVWQDNAGVNEKSQAESDQAALKLNIQCEYTAKNPFVVIHRSISDSLKGRQVNIH